MRFLTSICTLMIMLGTYNKVLADDYQDCLTLAKAKQSKGIHMEQACINAARDGHSDIRYMIGSSFNHSGEYDTALMLYKSAAEKGFPPAYLAIGHLLRSPQFNDKQAAIDWYKKYIEAGNSRGSELRPKSSDVGYAALQVSLIYTAMNDDNMAAFWREVCKRAKYNGCV